MITDKDKYHDFDDLGLYLTLVESSNVTFNPNRTIEFEIIKPLDFSEKVRRYDKGKLIFKNVFYCDLRLINEFNEYPEFYRNAILDDSKLLQDTIKKFKRLDKIIPENLKDYYLYILQGDTETEVHIICEEHNLSTEGIPILHEDINGFDE